MLKIQWKNKKNNQKYMLLGDVPSIWYIWYQLTRNLKDKCGDEVPREITISNLDGLLLTPKQVTGIYDLYFLDSSGNNSKDEACT